MELRLQLVGPVGRREVSRDAERDDERRRRRVAPAEYEAHRLPECRAGRLDARRGATLRLEGGSKSQERPGMRPSGWRAARRFASPHRQRDRSLPNRRSRSASASETAFLMKASLGPRPARRLTPSVVRPAMRNRIGSQIPGISIPRWGSLATIGCPLFVRAPETAQLFDPWRSGSGNGPLDRSHRSRALRSALHPKHEGLPWARASRRRPGGMKSPATEPPRTRRDPCTRRSTTFPCSPESRSRREAPRPDRWRAATSA